MNYKRLIENIKYIAGNHKLINSCESGDNIYDLNNMDEKIVYPIMYFIDQPHQLDNIMNKYNFIFYFVDRLLDDNSNKIDIHNSAIKALNDIVLEIDELQQTESDKPIAVTLFTAKFADECAGGFIEISIQTENDNSDCTSLINNQVLAIETEDNNLIDTQDNLTLIQE